MVHLNNSKYSNSYFVNTVNLFIFKVHCPFFRICITAHTKPSVQCIMYKHTVKKKKKIQEVPAAILLLIHQKCNFLLQYFIRCWKLCMWFTNRVKKNRKSQITKAQTNPQPLTTVTPTLWSILMWHNGLRVCLACKTFLDATLGLVTKLQYFI